MGLGTLHAEVTWLQCDNMAASGLGIEKPLVGADWAISLLGTNGLRKKNSPLALYGLHFCQWGGAMVGREP